jgi:hypothetical protein
MIDRIIRSLILVPLALACVGSAIWASFALWFQLPAPDSMRYGFIAVLVFLALIALIALFWRRHRRLALGYLMALGAVLLWWTLLKPAADRDWAADVAHGVTGSINGDILTLENVRNFEWRTPTDFTEHWENRTYDLSKLASVDLFLVYWNGPAIAHTIMSFGFEDGRHIDFSIEIRRQRDEEYSAIAGFFRQYELVFIAADERDLLLLRKANNEDVRIFRLRSTPQSARALLVEYVNEANNLAVNPRFYNTLTTTCTTTIFTLLKAVVPSVSLDWRIFLNGYLPSFAYEAGAVDTSIPLDALIARAAVSDKIEPGLSEVDFSRHLREGQPVPHDAGPTE